MQTNSFRDRQIDHWSTLFATKWRVSCCVFAAWPILVGLIHPEWINLTADFGTSLYGTTALTGLSFITVACCWIAGDIDQGVAKFLIFPDGSRVTFFLDRLVALISVETIFFLVLVGLCSFTSTHFGPHPAATVATAYLLLLSYLALAFSMSFVLPKAVPSIVFCYIFVLFLAAILQKIGLSEPISNVISYLSHLEAIVMGKGTLVDYAIIVIGNAVMLCFGLLSVQRIRL